MEEKLRIKLLSKEEQDEVITLQVAESQKDFIEPSKDCLQDLKNQAYQIVWNMHGIFLDTHLIGFFMHGKQTQEVQSTVPVWLDRMMVDEKYQHKGYGKKALQMILPQLFFMYQADSIYLSFIEGNQVAEKLYQSVGFIDTGEKDEMGERIMVLYKEHLGGVK